MKRTYFISLLLLSLFLIPVISAAPGDTLFTAKINGSENFTISDSVTSARVYPIVQGNTSTGIDQSFDPTWGEAFTTALKTGIDEREATVGNKRIFTPTKGKISNISIYATSTGTGVTWYLVIHDSNNIAISETEFTPVSGVNTIAVPALWTSGDMHFHVYASATTGTPSVKSGSAGNFETASYIEYYIKNTESTNITVNGNTIMLDTGDATGLLQGASVDTYRGFYNYTGVSGIGEPNKLLGVYAASSGAYTDGPPIVLNGYYGAFPRISIAAPISIEKQITTKICTILPIKNITINSMFYNSGGLAEYLQVSNDNSTWTTLRTVTSTGVNSYQDTTSVLDGNTTIYVRAYKAASVEETLSFALLSVNATLNTTISNATILAWQTGTNTVNILSYGNAVSSSLDPSNRTDVWLIEGESLIPPLVISSFTSTNISVATNSTSYGWEGFAPFTMQFTDASTGSPTSWVWNYTKLGSTTPVTFNSSTFNSPIYTFASTGNYSISLNATSATSSNISTQITWINVTTLAPTAYFTANKTSGSIPLPILFIDESPGLPDSWNWSVDDGILHWFNLTDSSNKNLEYIFNPVGSWRVNLTVKNISTASLESTMSMNITATNILPISSFTKSASYGTPSTVFIFNDTSTGNNIYAWNWSFGDGNISSSRNVSHQFPVGTYNVNLSVTNDGGSSSSIQTVYVSTFSTSYTANKTFGVAPMPVQFTETSSGFIVDSYYWEFGDGSTSIDQNPTHIYNAIGTFDVNHRIINGSTQVWSNKTAFIKTEIGNITPSFTASNTTSVDPPLSVQFTDTSTITNASPAIYYWVFGDGYTSSEQNPLHIFESYGNFNSNVTVSNISEGISKTSQSTAFTIISNRPSNISYNFVLNQVFPTTIRVKDSNTLALINGAKITDGEGNVNTLTNGILTNNYQYGSHLFTTEAEGYYSKTTSLFIVSNSTFTIELTPQSGGTQTIWWSPQDVELIVVDANHQVLTNTSVGATVIESTLPGGSYDTFLGMLQNAYGIPRVQAITMLNAITILNGTTDITGSVSFLMLPTSGYIIDIGNGNFTTTLYPKNTIYTIQTTGSGYTQPQNVVSNYNSNSYDTLNITEPDINHIKMQLFYYDATAQTNNIDFWVKLVDNDTYINNQSISVVNLKGPVLLNYTVENIRGQQWKWGYDATRI
jgi:PKD repeat protein